MKTLSIPFSVKDGVIIFNPITLSRFVKENEGRSGDAVIKESTITPRQRRSLELWLRMVAEALNESGSSVQLVLSKKMDIEWSHDLVKELLWRPAQEAIALVTSTKDLPKQEKIDLIRDHLMRHLGEKFGLEHIDWPHYETEEDYNRETTTFN